MNNLQYGSPLIMEDLNTTMNVVTFIDDRRIYRQYLNRILKNLQLRNIKFELKEKTVLAVWGTDFLRKAVLVVGDRTLAFEILREG